MAETHQLTKGALVDILYNEVRILDPILQILECRKISSSTSTTGTTSADADPKIQRLRLALSDGKFFTSYAMFTINLKSNADHQLLANCVKIHTIIKLKRYVTSVYEGMQRCNKRLLLILAAEVVADSEAVGRVIGEPKQLYFEAATSSTQMVSDISQVVGPYRLTEGALVTIMNKVNVADPVVQILSSRKISNSNNMLRFRITMSDGKFFSSNVFFTTIIQSDNADESMPLVEACTKTHTIIKLRKYLAIEVSNVAKNIPQVLIRLLDYQVLADGESVGRVIGEPEPVPLPLLKASTHTSNATSSRPTASNSGQVMGIISRKSSYHSQFFIMAHVYNKSKIKTFFDKTKGKQNFFTIDLLDDSGEIRCNVTGDIADKYYNVIQVNKVYRIYNWYVRSCLLELTDGEGTNTRFYFELNTVGNTVFTQCGDALGDANIANIPEVKYDFASIDTIAHMEVGVVVDVFAVCKSWSDIQTFTIPSLGRTVNKREVSLVDQSKAEIDLTIWDTHAENIDGSNSPVVLLIKGAKLEKCGRGKALVLHLGSILKINPDMRECYMLKSWYNLVGYQIQFKNISTRIETIDVGISWENLKDVKIQGLDHFSQGQCYQFMGTVLLFKSESASYKACPTEKCNKKVIALENGTYKCENCNKQYSNFKYHLCSSINVCDWTGNQWFAISSPEAEKVLGKTSHEVGLALEGGADEATKIFNNANFKQFIFKCRAEMNTHYDTIKLKTVVMSATSINYEQYNAHLLEKIQTYIEDMSLL